MIGESPDAGRGGREGTYATVKMVRGVGDGYVGIA